MCQPIVRSSCGRALVRLRLGVCPPGGAGLFYEAFLRYAAIAMSQHVVQEIRPSRSKSATLTFFGDSARRYRAQSDGLKMLNCTPIEYRE